MSRRPVRNPTAVPEFRGHSPWPRGSEKITTISGLRTFFHRNARPIYSFGPTDFNLAGISEWVGNFRQICQIDSYDGQHPNVFVPRAQEHEEFRSIPDINNYLLRNEQVIEHIRAGGADPVAVFLMFDETTEALCKELGLEIWFPAASVRSRCDSKVETVRLGDRAGVPSVPNVLAPVRSYAQLRHLAAEAGLGKHLVVQSPYGDSGHTTFFVSSEADWRRDAAAIAGEPEVKIMKRIDALGATLEACVTRCGTVVGPLLTEIVGHRELTPYRGGWAGNELFEGAFSVAVRAKAREYTRSLGSQLLVEGYRGYFDLDFLIDRDSGEIYLGELNPRICGASPLTNHATFAYADVPLFLFHLLEFSGVDFDLDIAELNARWSDPRFIDSWGALVLKSTSDEADLVSEAPSSGLWRLKGSGEVSFERFDYRRSAIETERDGLFLRITGPGTWRYEGADLGILITRGRLMTDDFELNERAHAWIAGLNAAYRTEAAGRRGADAIPIAPSSAQPFKLQ
jgi:biotin carboxylase